MDVTEAQINKGDSLPNSDNLNRIVLKDMKEKNDKFLPHVKCFSLSPADKDEGYGLSVDWDKKTTPEDTIIRVGCSYKGDSEVFKEYANREIYSLNIEILKTIVGVVDIKYDPIINLPEQKGRPSNISHSLIYFSEEEYKKNEPIIILQIRNHAKDRKVEVDMAKVDNGVQQYRNAIS